MNEGFLNLIVSLDGVSIWDVLKWFYVMAFGLYLLFALVVLAQIRQMVSTLHGQLDRGLQLIGLIHLGVAVAALLAAIMVL